MDNNLVQAEFSFKGSNNDELCFKKGDLIVITNRDDKDWWEGTLISDGKTGWFPSNYVIEYKAPPPPTDTIRPPEEIHAFRMVVFNDLLDSEKAHCAELRGLYENFLEPLQKSQILTTDEYAQLMCNFVEVMELHEELLRQLEECNDRIGKLFLTKAPIMKKTHHAYCTMHPKAIVIVDKYKEDLNNYMEQQGAAKPGILVLTTGLSKAFRRLEKYSAILQELERHMDTGHVDRGDTQRSISVYKELAASSSAIRRQKELELQILTGPIRGWQGESLNTMGEIIHMGSVAVGNEHLDRYFILLEQNLLILSVSQRMSAFKYEGKIPITGISVKRLEDTDKIKNALEITGPLIDRILAICQSSNEANKWVDLLGRNNTIGNVPELRQDLKRNTSFSTSSNLSPNMSPPPGISHPARNTNSMQQISQHKRSLSFNHHLSYNQVQQQQQNFQMSQQQNQMQQHQQHPVSFMKHPPSHPLLGQRKEIVPITNQNIIKSTTSQQMRTNWSITNLRPAFPLRPCFSNMTNNHINPQLKYELSTKKMQPTYEEDALVLRVIEAYCAAYQNSSRNTIHSGVETEELATPTLRQLFIAMRQIQHDISDIKSQLSQERALRGDLQKLLLHHLESSASGGKTCGLTADLC